MSSRVRLSFPDVIGSLWFAAVLLALLVVAMAAGTVCESRYGTDHALVYFYRSWWLEGLLGLLALNIVAAILVRAPFTRQRIGFLFTHLSVLVVFAGALISWYAGLDGRLVLSQGQTAEAFQRSGEPMLTVALEGGQPLVEKPLAPTVFMGFEELSDLRIPPLISGDLRIEIRRYLPDGQESRRLVDHRPDGKAAIEAAFLSEGHDFSTWVFAGETASAGTIPVAFTMSRSAEDEEKWVATIQPDESKSKGTVKVECAGQSYSYPLEQCLDKSVAVGETGYSIRVTRYLPHAVVGPDKTIVSASSQPVNPYIEAELIGPDGTETRRAFAQFPDFDGMHGTATSRPVAVSFEAPDVQISGAPAEVLSGPDGRLFVRFNEMGRIVSTTELTVGAAVDTPWPGWKFVVRDRRDGAQWERTVVPVPEVRKEDRQPAILLAFRGPGGESEKWVLYGEPATVEVGGRFYDVHFADSHQPMGFQVKLEDFRVVTYPGTQKPRSFESRVTIQDPRAGSEISRIISMNHPLSYGGYDFYQSSYSREAEGFASVLRVSRDPGRPVVFAGYIAVLAGMVWVLVRRMTQPK